MDVACQTKLMIAKSRSHLRQYYFPVRNQVSTNTSYGACRYHTLSHNVHGLPAKVAISNRVCHPAWNAIFMRAILSLCYGIK
jgi:hypothetical protein